MPQDEESQHLHSCSKGWAGRVGRAARKSLLAVLGNSCPEYKSEYVVTHKMCTEVVWVNAEREVAAEHTL